MQERLQQYEQKIISLKARILDLQDAAGAESDFHRNVFIKMAELLEIPADKSGDINSYFDAIVELKSKAQSMNVMAPIGQQ